MDTPLLMGRSVRPRMNATLRPRVRRCLTLIAVLAAALVIGREIWSSPLTDWAAVFLALAGGLAGIGFGSVHMIISQRSIGWFVYLVGVPALLLIAWTKAVENSSLYAHAPGRIPGTDATAPGEWFAIAFVVGTLVGVGLGRWRRGPPGGSG